MHIVTQARTLQAQRESVKKSVGRYIKLSLEMLALASAAACRFSDQEARHSLRNCMLISKETEVAGT